MKKTLLISATQKNSKDFYQTSLYKSMFHGTLPAHEKRKSHDLFSDETYDLIVKTNNTDKITKHYNKGIQFARENIDEYSHVILVHDDVSVEDKMMHSKLDVAHETFDIVGLAGASDVQIKSPVLWHVMSTRKSWSGAVAHKGKTGKVFMTNFGDSPKRCLVLDGLFLSVKINTLINTPKLLFDENIPSIAHFYDIDFCLTANTLGLKMTTWPIWAVHNSPGLEQQTSEFNKGQKYILNKWKK
jgi:hypothetical protein